MTHGKVRGPHELDTQTNVSCTQILHGNLTSEMWVVAHVRDPRMTCKLEGGGGGVKCCSQGHYQEEKEIKNIFSCDRLWFECGKCNLLIHRDCDHSTVHNQMQAGV